MKKNVLRFLLALPIFGMVLTGCSSVNKEEAKGINEELIEENGNFSEPMDIVMNEEKDGPEGEYSEGIVLIKTYDNEIDFDSLDLDIKSVEEIYPQSPWKRISLKTGDTKTAIKYLRGMNIFEKVDYDYIMASTVEIDTIDVSSNPNASELSYLDTQCIGNAWGYANHNGLGGSNGGGSPDVVVAVIDTGVDYNHIDIRNNIWVNTGEIPNNGIDDDNNGYIDDIRGWDCVNEDNNPMDDNGHGTHVAGIIAAENNSIGTVGVAFNCKVMPIKAGTSSGSFTNADIAQAITYAYMNGASVINMSFGGASISLAVEDALENAYYQCALVAAAGNSGLCNQPGCPYCIGSCQTFYPASLPYVVGVMSCNADGSHISSFSNYDHAPFHYNSCEYDCYACGEQITSLWPNNKFAKMSGTSMASPVVAGIAALLRSAYPNREVYSNKYIHSQLTNTGSLSTVGVFGTDIYHPLCDAYQALTKVPAPHIYSLYNYYIFDNEEFSANNNGDGFIDAGETIRLGIELQNRGGQAFNVTAKIDTMRNNDPSLTDPNITIVQDTIHFDDIGTYSTQDGGKIYGGDKVVNMTNAFVINVSPDAPNGYSCSIRLSLEYYNGLAFDATKYIGDVNFTIDIYKGVKLNGTITEDTIFGSDKSYIIDGVLRIAEGVTVTFEEGCLIEYYSSSAGYIDTLYNSPSIEIYGTLVFDGSESNMITVRPVAGFEGFACMLNPQPTGTVNCYYCDFNNIHTKTRYGELNFYHCLFSLNKTIRNNHIDHGLMYYEQGRLVRDYAITDFYFTSADYCKFDFSLGQGTFAKCKSVSNSLIITSYLQYCCFESCSFVNNLFVASGKAIGTNNTNGGYIKLYYEGSNVPCAMVNNSFISSFVVNQLRYLPNFKNDLGSNISNATVSGNVFSNDYINYASALIENNVNSSGEDIIPLTDTAMHDDSLIWPYIKNISIVNGQNQVVHTVGTERNTVRVTFSRDMDVSKEFSLFYGSSEPYSDYQIQGQFVSDSVWEGELKVKSYIEGGIQYFSSKGGCAKNNEYLTLCDNANAFTFNIDTSSALSMALQANPTEQGVELTWVQDDYDTLMGYNIYRSEDKDGNFTRLNSSIIPAGENTFFDDSCEPGRTYWYTFTVVLSDFSESAPAGKVMATPIDTIAPVIYHTPVNQGYCNNNLVISCSASDNIAVTAVTLYYRTIGDVSWNTLSMTKDNNRYSAVIFGSEVTMAGLEYYISATDGRNTITRGSADNPYQVLVKDASLLNNLGDVDGDGSITTRDALMIMQAINGDLLLTPDQFTRADLDKNGVLNTFEALRILQYINGNVSTLEM